MDRLDSFSPVLATLAREHARQADMILDLRESVLRGEQPGQCVQCYFKLLGISRNTHCLTALRSWIERHIEIRACGPGRQLLEKLPVDLTQADDLETFCRSISSTVYHDRAELPDRVELSFAYRQDSAA